MEGNEQTGYMVRGRNEGNERRMKFNKRKEIEQKKEGSEREKWRRMKSKW